MLHPPLRVIPAIVATKTQKCLFCGNRRYPRHDCPTRNVTYRRCGEIGHFTQACRSWTSATLHSSNSVVMAAYFTDLFAATFPIELNGKKVSALVDTRGKLYQFCRVPFGVTKRVACFQKIIDRLTTDNSLSRTFAYFDNITICGKSQVKLDENLSKFTEASKKFNLITIIINAFSPTLQWTF